MFSVGNVVVYKRDVCKIKEIRKNYLSGKDYYVLSPIDDNSLTTYVPIDNSLGFIRNIISRDEAYNLINKIPYIDVIVTNEKNYENEYKKLLSEDSLENLVKIIKTSYIRNDNRIQNKKKISEKDDNYFKCTEKLLYNELSISLGMKYQYAKEYIIQYVQMLVSNN